MRWCSLQIEKSYYYGKGLHKLSYKAIWEYSAFTHSGEHAFPPYLPSVKIFVVQFADVEMALQAFLADDALLTTEHSSLTYITVQVTETVLPKIKPLSFPLIVQMCSVPWPFLDTMMLVPIEGLAVSVAGKECFTWMVTLRDWLSAILMLAGQYTLRLAVQNSREKEKKTILMCTKK